MERITDKDWEKKVRPNLATLPTEELLALARSLRTGQFNATMEILGKFIENEGQTILQPVIIKKGIQEQDK